MEESLRSIYQYRPSHSAVPLSSCAKPHESILRLPLTPPDVLDDCDQGTDEGIIQTALHVLDTERNALTNLHEVYLSDKTAQHGFVQAVNTIAKASLRSGRVIVSGVGKSGKIGEKFVATLNSFGIRSAFLHPTDATHGDLGMIGPNDALVILTYSGKTQEILSMLPFLPADLPIIAVTSHRNLSSCPLFVHRPSSNCILLPAPIPRSELDSFGVPAPTSSTTTALAIADAVALASARRLHTSPLKVFHKNHPGGTIGASAAFQDRPQLMADLAVKVGDIPLVTSQKAQLDSTILDAVLTAAISGSGWVRPSSENVIAPRQIQRMGRMPDLNQRIRLLGNGIVTEKEDWISVEAATSVQEARDWILRMRQAERGKTFLRKGTVLGIVDAQRCVSGVVEIEEIVRDEELDE